MMKFVALGLSLFLLSMPSQAKRTPVQRALDGQSALVQRTLTATRSVLVHALPRAQRRLLITNELGNESDGPAGPDELDLQSFYERPRINRQNTPDSDCEDLSDYVTIRLAVARAKAMEIYRNKWA